MLAPTLSNTICRTWTGQPAYWEGLACHQTPDDLWNFIEVIWKARPRDVLEIGRGEGGTSDFLDTVTDCLVYSVDIGDKRPALRNAFIILDADVYNRDAVLNELRLCSTQARWLVVCHTNREDWGAASALREWRLENTNWRELTVNHPTQHTWLERA
jgi:hypothetical protein